jgi:hypothetical protein
MAIKKITRIEETDEIRISVKLTAKADPEIFLWLVSHKNNQAMESKLIKVALKKLILSGEFPVSDSINNVELDRTLKLYLDDLKSRELVANTEAIDTRLRANPKKIAVTNKNQEDQEAVERHKQTPHPVVAPIQATSSEMSHQAKKEISLVNERQSAQAAASQAPLQPPSHGGNQVAENEAKGATGPLADVDILEILDSFSRVSD